MFLFDLKGWRVGTKIDARKIYLAKRFAPVDYFHCDDVFSLSTQALVVGKYGEEAYQANWASQRR